MSTWKIFQGGLIMPQANGRNVSDDEYEAEDASQDDHASSLSTAIVAGAAVAIVAPQLLPGMAIGVAAMLAPRILPSVGFALRPLVKTAVKAGYSATMSTRELVAEAGEQVQDLVAEVKSEQEATKRATSSRKRTTRTPKASRAHA
jgi:hypothetical protein